MGKQPSLRTIPKDLRENPIVSQGFSNLSMGFLQILDLPFTIFNQGRFSNPLEIEKNGRSHNWKICSGWKLETGRRRTQDGAPKISGFMVDITIVNGGYFMVYKPFINQLISGPHPASIMRTVSACYLRMQVIDPSNERFSTSQQIWNQPQCIAIHREDTHLTIGWSRLTKLRKSRGFLCSDRFSWCFENRNKNHSL